MKKLNVVLLIVLILMLAFVAYFFIGGTLHAQASIATAPASDYPDVCKSITNIVNSGAAPQQFAALPPSPSGCTLVDMTITLTNPGLFEAEWIDISVSPADGDIAVYSLTGESSTLSARATGQVNLKLVTSAPADAARRITLDYYVFGMLRSVTIEAVRPKAA